MRRNAFSIIELLVVVGIITILIALLLPTFAKARQQSQLVSCKAQLQNIGQALALYLTDNQNRYPPAPYSPTFNPRPLRLVNDYLLRYIATSSSESARAKLFACPADETYFARYALSYSYQQELGERGRLEQSSIYRVMRAASRVPVLWDADDFHGARVPYNWLFADGHVDGFLDDLSETAAAPATQPQ